MLIAILKHVKALILHKWFVLVAGLRVGGIPIWRLIIHDWTKFTPAEFLPYVRHHQLKSKSERDAFSYACAWLHHENMNPHHWGYWIPRSGAQVGKPLPMPESYVREMFADWMGAGRTYTGSWDMSEWLDKSLPHIASKKNMAWATVEDLSFLLIRFGYVEQEKRMLEAYSGYGYRKVQYDGAEWVRQNITSDVSPLGANVADLLGEVWQGIYHIQKWLDRVNWSDNRCIEVVVGHPLATVDDNRLTVLVTLAHERMLRVEVLAHTHGYLKLVFHQRQKREGRLWERCPAIESHVSLIKRHYGYRDGSNG